MRSIFKFGSKYMKPFKLMMIVYIILTILIAGAELSIPYALGKFIDLFAAGNAEPVIFGAVILSLYLASVLMGFIHERLYLKIQIVSSNEMNLDGIAKLQTVSVLNKILEDPSYMNHRINNDANMITMFHINTIARAFANFAKFIIPMVVFFAFDTVLGILLLGLNLAYAAVYFIMKKPIFKANKRFSEKNSKYYSALNEQVSDIEFLQTHGLNRGFINKLTAPFKILKDAAIKRLNIRYIFNSSDKFFLAIATTSVFIWGGNQVMKGQMTAGELIIIISHFNLMMQATWFFFTISGNIPEVEFFKKRMEEIFDVPSIPEGDKNLPEIHSIEIENMSFAYPESNPVFTRYNQKFERGNIYVLKGHNGSGKTTFIKILLGLYKSEMEGSVLYNGKEIGSLDMTKIRKEKIAVSEQEPFLLKSSVLQNITHGANIPIEDIDKTIKMIDLEKVIENLEHGLDTNIEEGSTNLSGGEKQKIALARTILKNADLIILDEPTSAMDAEGKERFLEYIKDHAKDKIVIISTHDSDICEISDQVINFGENKGVHIESI